MTQDDVTRIAAMVACARACLGTPFHHQGRCAGAGLDCIGLIVLAMRSAALEVQDSTDYGSRPDGVSLVAALEAHGWEKVEGSIEAGDVLLFRYDHQPQHVGLATSSRSLIHSFAPAGKVVETTLGMYWLHRLVGVYRLPRGAVSE